MSQITEPLSKHGLFMEMQAQMILMAAFDAMAAEPDVDLQAVEQGFDDAAAALIELHRQAEDNGLMRELRGYLSTTYGG